MAAMPVCERLRRAARAAPKCEHHVHLEGALVGDELPPPLAHDGPLGFEDFRRWFAAARAVWDRPDSGRALARLLEQTLAALLDERIVWTRYNVSPWYYDDLGLDRLTEALRRFRTDAAAAGVEVSFLLGARRSASPAELEARIGPLLREHGDLFVGVDFQGNELADPSLTPFAETIAGWQALGASVRAHAGEYERLGAERVIDAARLGLREICHGGAALASEPRPLPALDAVAWFHLCPISNRALGAADWWREPGAYLPYLERLTISTDDPAVFGCRLSGELALLAEHGAEPATIRRLIANGYRAADFGAPRRAALERELEERFAEEGLVD